MDKIICVGRNYSEHASEMNEAVSAEPIFFLKPPSCLNSGPQVELPRNRGQVHFECEIVYRIRKAQNRASFDAVTLGIDLTLRDLQAELKKKSLPWEAAKSFASAAIVGPWIPISEFKEHLKIPFQLQVNGDVRQMDCGEKMRSSPEQLLSAASQIFTVCDGDLMFTGTPKGVGAVVPNDRAKLSWENKLEHHIQFV